MSRGHRSLGADGTRLDEFPRRRGPAPAAAAASTNQAILNLTVGGMLNGTFASPPARTQIYVTTKNPDVALAETGFAGDSGGPPVEKLFAACKSAAQGGGVQADCTRGMTAMFNGALGAAATDPNGHAQTPGIPPGHYYLVGFTPIRDEVSRFASAT